jgi:hypothetical protein
MFDVRRFRFRSPERNRQTDERRLTFIRKAVHSAVADAEAESKGLRARIAKARRSVIVPVAQVDEADGTRRADLTAIEQHLLGTDQRLAQLDDHLAQLRKLARRLDRLIELLPPDPTRSGR